MKSKCVMNMSLENLNTSRHVIFDSDALQSNDKSLKEVLAKRNQYSPQQESQDRNLVFGMALCHELIINSNTNKVDLKKTDNKMTIEGLLNEKQQYNWAFDNCDIMNSYDFLPENALSRTLF